MQRVDVEWDTFACGIEVRGRRPSVVMDGIRDDVRAKLRTSIKRLLRKYGYPPDQQPAAIAEVMSQMESMAPRFASVD